MYGPSWWLTVCTAVEHTLEKEMAPHLEFIAEPQDGEPGVAVYGGGVGKWTLRLITPAPAGPSPGPSPEFLAPAIWDRLNLNNRGEDRTP